MGLMSFFKDAGEKLFGKGEAKAAQEAAAKAPSPETIAALNATAGKAVADYVATQGIAVDSLDITFDGATSTVTASGVVGDQATKEKILLCCGNVAGVGAVNDMMTVAEPAPESRFHMVEKGDTLSAVAKKAYGNANAYMKIFEANKPMLSHPDKIYPGQMLRIPD